MRAWHEQGRESSRPCLLIRCRLVLLAVSVVDVLSHSYILRKYLNTQGMGLENMVVSLWQCVTPGEKTGKIVPEVSGMDALYG